VFLFSDRRRHNYARGQLIHQVMESSHLANATGPVQVELLLAKILQR